MKFLVTFEIFETMTQETIKSLRSGVGQGIQQIMSSPKTLDAGFFTDTRGAYFVFDIEEAIDLYDLLGPEIYDNARVTVHPLASAEDVGRRFEAWAQQGR